MRNIVILLFIGFIFIFVGCNNDSRNISTSKSNESTKQSTDTINELNKDNDKTDTTKEEQEDDNLSEYAKIFSNSSVNIPDNAFMNVDAMDYYGWYDQTDTSYAKPYLFNRGACFGRPYSVVEETDKYVIMKSALYEDSYMKIWFVPVDDDVVTLHYISNSDLNTEYVMLQGAKEINNLSEYAQIFSGSSVNVPDNAFMNVDAMGYYGWYNQNDINYTKSYLFNRGACFGRPYSVVEETDKYVIMKSALYEDSYMKIWFVPVDDDVVTLHYISNSDLNTEYVMLQGPLN